ncbi:MAG: ATP-binding protein [Chloroflexota bacterium]
MATREFDTPIALSRDVFMRQLIAGLGHLNEGILGADIAGAYIMNVGLSMGAAIESEYKAFWKIERPFTLSEYAHVIVDLKQKIRGNFSLVSLEADKVVVRTSSCPFDEFVRQSPSLCFMTSSVFGGIAARNFGYSKVILHRRIALGDDGCLVTIFLRPTPESELAIGRVYYPDQDQASPNIAEQLRLMDNVRHLRRQLVETNSRWEEIVRGAADAVCILDAQGAAVFANARWRDLLGVEGDELVGGGFERMVHPEDQARFSQLLTRVQGGERFVSQHVRLLHRTDAWRDAVMSAGPIRDEAGVVLGTLGIFRDATEEREAERLKDRLLSTTSHELRTPVATIKGMTQLLLRTLDQRGSIAPEQLVQRLQIIEREAERLAMLGADLVDVTTLQSGRLSIDATPQDVRTVVERCVERQRALLTTGSRHQIHLELPDAPQPARIQAARIEQIVGNLIENAVKYSPDGGQIVVRVTGNRSGVQVDVTDPGIGIPAADLKQIFTPFFRASNAPVRNFAGLGLGLYLSKLIAEAHGGDLTVSSMVGAGTTCTLVLPTEHRAETTSRE